jgi:Spy/CpxP family protein refolding chaperone
LFETNPDLLLQRIQDAQDAIMDQIEDSCHTASQTEHRELLSARNALRELRRVSDPHGSRLPFGARSLSDVA